MAYRKQRMGRRKVCYFTKNKVAYIDYKDVERVLVAGLISKELEFVETPVKDDLKYAYVKRVIR